MLQTIILFGGFMCISVISQGIAIYCIRERADNSTYIVKDVIADITSNDRLQIICRISSISNLVSFKYINISQLTSNASEQTLATMQDVLSGQPGYKTPYLSPGSGITGSEAVGTYNRTHPTIGISIPVSSMRCYNDTYQCQLLYEYDGWPTEPILERQAYVSRNLTVAGTCVGKLPEHIDSGLLVAIIIGVVGFILLVAALVTVFIRKCRKTQPSAENLANNNRCVDFFVQEFSHASDFLGSIGYT